mgnify:CR=1 FL=1
MRRLMKTVSPHVTTIWFSAKASDSAESPRDSEAISERNDPEMTA